jgi:hypothetical protein
MILLPALTLQPVHSSLEEEKNCESTSTLVHSAAGMTPKSSRASDPLVHHGRHFGRAVHAMCNVQVLVTSGIVLLAEEGGVAEELLTSESVSPLPANQLTWLSSSRQRQEYRVFQQLLKMVPRITEHLMESSEEECMMIADLVCFSFCSSD